MQSVVAQWLLFACSEQTDVTARHRKRKTESLVNRLNILFTKSCQTQEASSSLQNNNDK